MCERDVGNDGAKMWIYVMIYDFDLGMVMVL
jgi:hypothetical protein